eukprot:297517_1
MTKLLLSYRDWITDFNYNFFIDKIKKTETQKKWIKCFCELITDSNGLNVNKIDQTLHRNISEEINRIYQQEYEKRKKNKNYNNSELMQNLKTIQEEMRIDYANSIQSPSIHQFQPSNADLSSIAFSAMVQEKSKELSWKYYYHNKITDKQNNSCIGIKFISLKDASVRWCLFDFIHACILLALCIIYIRHGQQLDFFPLRFYNHY